MEKMKKVEEQNSTPFFWGIFPKCPFYQSVVAVLIVLTLIALGTIGIYFLNLWAAVSYLIFSILFYFLIMPFTMCKYCYYKVTETTIDKKTGKTIKKLMSIEKWRESSGIEKHVGQKNWTYCMSVIWILPIVLIIILFFKDFSIFALISLIGFIATLVGNYYYLLRKKCPTCAMKEDCHSAFSNLVKK